ncbi:MAG: aminoglycoside phosphotransferase family protein [Myxococcota bacterium]
MNILKSWQHLEPGQPELITVGNINQTYKVKLNNGFGVLQKLHPVFAPEVNVDILNVTDYLAQHHFHTQKLLKTDSGDLWALEESQCWRMLTYVEGHTFDEVKNPELGFSAGQLVGRFHKALSEFDYEYQSVRSNVHNTPAYLERLERNLKEGSAHPLFESVSGIAHELIKEARSLPDLWAMPARHSHGDLKISNIIFDSKQEADCLIDLDTLGKMPWPIEMGDAFRSWCNPLGENQAVTAFDMEVYRAALEGYKEHAWKLWSKAERNSLKAGIKLIPLELCARFLIDIFEDHYWKWDPERFECRADHNWLRAQSQWNLFKDIQRKL